MNKDMWALEICLPKKDYDAVLAILAFNISYGWEEKEQEEDIIQLLIHNEDKEFLEKISCLITRQNSQATATLAKIANTDFLSTWKEFFTPVYCGENFVIVPPWLSLENYSGRKKIVIEPKSAFGTGHHITTVLCLEALDQLIARGRLRGDGFFLDLGCGTAVLGIAAVLAGFSGICVDIDPLAVENARENASLNRIEDSLLILEGSIEVVSGKKFQLIMANILAEPLIQMAPAIVASLEPDGCLVLSGILETQAENVIQAFINCSMARPAKIISGEWCALVWS